jgi:hypothetical protein
MTKGQDDKRTKEQTIIYKSLHRQLNIEQHEPHNNQPHQLLQISMLKEHNIEIIKILYEGAIKV